jgi:hypothetical protein
MALDEGFQVEGATVERVAFFHTINCKDRVDWVYKKIVLHKYKEKGPFTGPGCLTRSGIRRSGIRW